MEAGKIPREFYALTQPFTVQNTDFVVGKGINTDIYPKQLRNKTLYLSSAEGVDSELYDQYKLCFQKMLMGDPEYFVADLNCDLSLHPFINGKPSPPLVTQDVIDNAFKTNPYRATREYYNRFDNDSNEDAFIKRSVLNKYSKPYYPVFNNDTLDRTFILAYDPSTKLDNSVVAVAELKHDDEKGYWVEFVNMVNLVEILSNGEKVLIQKPDQVDRIKEMLIDYNQGALDYDNINMLIIDAGAGGGGEDIGQYLMREWVGHDKKRHLGLIDLEDEYMKVREDDYPANVQKLRMFNFKRDKVRAYERAQNAINQGLAIFPTSLNPRMELEFEETDAEGNIRIRYENVNEEERNALIQLDLAKEELVAMVKNKRPNGTVQFDLSPDAKSRNFHDDRADVVCMILDRLMELRATEALQVDKPQSDLAKVYSRGKIQGKASHNPFANGTNPFYDRNRRFL